MAVQMNPSFYLLLTCCMAGVLMSVGVELEVVVMVSSAAQFNTSGVIPALDLALQNVNNCSFPFNLSYSTILDSEVYVLKPL